MACLDTDFLVGYLRNNRDVKEKLLEFESKGEPLHVTTISAVELYRGAFRAKDAQTEVARVKNLIEAFLVLTLDHESARLVGEFDNKIKSNPIGESDLLIAGIALANKQTLITKNTKHFERVPGLRTEGW